MNKQLDIKELENAEGKRILEFCVRNNLDVTNTYYQHKEALKWTWHG